MQRNELAVLPEGTMLYVISRKISRSGMRQTFDVCFMNPAARPGESAANWIRIPREDGKEFNDVATCHASLSLDQDRRLGGTFYVNGCGFNRPAEVVESLSRWATGNPSHFHCTML